MTTQVVDFRLALIRFDYNFVDNTLGPQVRYAYIPDDDTTNFTDQSRYYPQDSGWSPIGGHWYRWVHFGGTVASPDVSYPDPGSFGIDLTVNPPNLSALPTDIGRYHLAAGPDVYLQLHAAALPSGVTDVQTFVQSAVSLAPLVTVDQGNRSTPTNVDSSGAPYTPPPNGHSMDGLAGAFVYTSPQQATTEMNTLELAYRSNIGALSFWRTYVVSPPPPPPPPPPPSSIGAPGWPDSYGLHYAHKGSSLSYG